MSNSSRALLFQVPFNLLAAIYIWKKMTFPAPPTSKTHANPTQEEPNRRSKLRRIDFSGSVSLALANVSVLLLLDQVQASPDTFGQDSSTLFPLSTWLVFMTLFFFAEAFWAREPIIPLRLLAKRNVVSSYAIQFLQTGAQMALYTSVPLYFRVTDGDTSSRAAIRLLVITIGTVVGSLVSGYAIKRHVSPAPPLQHSFLMRHRTGLYRLVTLLSTALSSLSFLAIFLRWRGPTSWGETLYGFPIGMAFGVSLSAAFIGLTADLEPYQVAVGTSGFYMCLNLGSLVGVSAASTLICTFVERALREGLAGLPDVEDIVREVTSSFERINELPEEVARVVLEAYTRSFGNVWCKFALGSFWREYDADDVQCARSYSAAWRCLPASSCARASSIGSRARTGGVGRSRPAAGTTPAGNRKPGRRSDRCETPASREGGARWG